MKKIWPYLLSLNVSTKISLTIAGLTLLLMMSVITINLMNVQSQSEKLIAEFTNMVIRSNENYVVKTLLADDPWSLYKFLKSLSSNSIIRQAGFIDNGGRIVAHTDAKMYPRGNLWHHLDSDRIITVPLNNQGKPLGVFVLHIENHRILDLLTQTLYTHLLFLVLAMLFSLGVGMMITRRILSRLSFLSANAKAIKEQRWDDIHPINSNENDEITKLVNSLTIMMKTQQESVLKEEQMKVFYHSILSSINALVLICDQHLNPIYHNDHPLKNIILSSEIGNTILSNSFVSQISTCLSKQKGKLFPCSWEMVVGEKNKKSLLIHSRPLNDQFVMIISDTTKIKELEEHYQLSRSFTMIGEISASFAHQIKNLLLPLKLLMQPTNDLTDRDKQMIHSLFAKMNDIVGNFLTIGESIDTELDHPFSCEEIVSKVTFMLSARMESKRITLHLEIEHEPLIMMDPKTFERIVTDLLANAIDASPQEGLISLFWHRYDDTFGEFLIEDQGKGIDDHIKDHIFDPFFTTKKGGNGLGLFHVYRTVYLYKGRIDLSSRPGLTRFSLLLPISKGD